MVEVHLLLADDDPDDCYVFSQVIDRIKPRVKFTCVEDCESLLKYLDSSPLPDVLFLDLNMPVLTGQECLRAIKERLDWKTIPIIIYSTATGQHIIDECYELGADLYVIKPSDPNKLKDTLTLIISKFVRSNN